jgi:hypothetical protein
LCFAQLPTSASSRLSISRLSTKRLTSTLNDIIYYFNANKQETLIKIMLQCPSSRVACRSPRAVHFSAAPGSTTMCRSPHLVISLLKWLQLNQAVGTSKQAACVCGPTFPVCPIHYTINSSTRSLIGLGPIDKTFKSPLSIALLQSCVTPAQTLVTLIPIRVGRGATAATFVSVSITVKRRRGSCKADRGWDRCSSLFYHRARLSVISPSRDRDGRGIQVARFRRFRPKYDKKLRKRRCYRFGDGVKMAMGRSRLFGHFGGV